MHLYTRGQEPPEFDWRAHTIDLRGLPLGGYRIAVDAVYCSWVADVLPLPMEPAVADYDAVDRWVVNRLWNRSRATRSYLSRAEVDRFGSLPYIEEERARIVEAFRAKVSTIGVEVAWQWLQSCAWDRKKGELVAEADLVPATRSHIRD